MPELSFDLNLIIQNAINFLWHVAAFAAPALLLMMAWQLWVYYLNFNFIHKMKWVTLQIRIPRDVFKTPQAMELILINALHQTGGTGTWFAKYWLGKVRMWFSLEIVSIEGNVFFFIHSPSSFKDLIESQIYSQYPRAEVLEVPDYAPDAISKAEDEGWSVWGSEFKLTKSDPYPIKTYVDYGLDKAQNLEEEQRIDPITPMMEFLGSMGKGEQMWYQIIVRAATDRYPKPGTRNEMQSWQKEGEAEIQKIMEKYATEDEKGKKKTDFMKVPKSAQDTINAINRAMDKPGFDCGFRAIYMAKKESFRAGNITGLLSVVKQYNSNNLNGFRPTNTTDFDYPWQDFWGKRVAKLKKEIMHAYLLRSFFYMPHKKVHVARKKIEREPFILNSEELATIYHFPGQVSETPSFKRIESKKAEPPANLPL